MTDAADLQLAFVSVPGGSIFMEEILQAVAEAVSASGTRTVCHQGYLSDVAQANTRFVVVPHEYFALAPEEPADLYAATVGLGVEHPGTQTFTSALAAARKLGARFEISRDAVADVRARGLSVEHFSLGYVPSWDRRPTDLGAERPIDVAYLGTADERRLALLAAVADDLADLRTEFLIPPHEPMTKLRPDFLPSDEKWRLLAQSKVIINLHREGKTGFEWVRCLEAVINGCLVVTEPSTDLAPLVPGEHLLIAEPSRIGAVVRAAVHNATLRDRIADNAYRLCRSELDMAGSVRRLVDAAAGLAAPSPVVGVPRPPARDDGDAPLAVWIPQLTDLPASPVPGDAETARELCDFARLRSDLARVHVARGSARPTQAAVDVICVRRPGDGPLGATIASLRRDADIAAVHVAETPRAPAAPAGDLRDVATYLTADHLLGRGQLRNLLVKGTDADLVCVLDSGDTVRGPALRRLVDLMQREPGIDVAYEMATLGADRMVNVLVPEQRRLLTRVYLTRGFLVRRRWLEKLGGFAEDPLLEDLVDHAFWLASERRGASIRLLRSIGFGLWPQTPRGGPARFDAARATAALMAAVDRPS